MLGSMATTPRVAPKSHSRSLSRSALVAAVTTALPPIEVTQAEAKKFTLRWLRDADERLLDVFENAGVTTRHVCMPLDWYEQAHTFEEVSACYAEHALELARAATTRALSAAALEAKDVDHVVFVSSTGIASPTIGARLANVLGFRDDVRRTPVWGLGCSGGVAGLALTRDLALARPDAHVLLIALELCSLSHHRQDQDRRSLIAASLFGDGAAAVIVRGTQMPAGADGAGTAPRIALVDASTTTWKNTLDVMGWTVDGTGLHVVMSRDIPAIVRTRLRPAMNVLLARNELVLEDVRHLVAHPGGPKVLDAVAQALDVSPEVLGHARRVLDRCGNMSSPTCLFVLERALAAGDFAPGDWGVIFALGPGFSAEQILLRAL